MTFKKGDAVFSFYRMTQRCQASRQYFAALDAKHGAQRPRMGMSEGYVPGRVAADVEGEDQDVSVEYLWPHFFTERGNCVCLTDADPWIEWHRVGEVLPAGDFLRTIPRRGPCPPASEPTLGILAFRWGGMNSIIAPAQWGETGSSVSDLFVNSFIEQAVAPRLGRDYEVWTVYIEDLTDLAKLADSAHLIFGPNHPVRRAKHVCAMYFLYPTAFEENCIPTMETGEDHGAAMVDQKSLLRLMKAVEKLGVPTRFPHASGLYQQLASKSWTHVMSVVPHLRVLPTVALPRMLVEQDCGLAGERALATLKCLKANQAALRGETASQEPITKGVAKLGFSWEALDVKFWEGQQGLKDALWSLTQMIEISGEMTGQPHDCESILVQEYCKHDLELRAYVVEGKVEAVIYTKFCRIKENSEFGDFEELFTAVDAANAWMGGDLDALQDGDRQCREVTAHWLQWVQAQSCEMPSGIRFDYFVHRTGPGKAEVWTLEICELGFSMLGEKELPAKVFAAMLRQCLGESPAPGAGALQNGAAAETTAGEAPQEPAAAAPSQPEEVPLRSKGNGKQGGKKGGPKGQPSPPAQPPRAGKGGAGSSVSMPPTPAPEALVLNAPNGIPAQRKCTGKYTLEPSITANSRPVWKHTRGDRWLYCGTDEHWYVGDTDEYQANFVCCEGYLRHPGATKGLLPHQLEGWERFDTKSDEWRRDKDITATLPSP